MDSKLEKLREFAVLDFKPIGWIKSNPVEDTIARILQ